MCDVLGFKIVSRPSPQLGASPRARIHGALSFLKAKATEVRTDLKQAIHHVVSDCQEVVDRLSSTPNTEPQAPRLSDYVADFEALKKWVGEKALALSTRLTPLVEQISPSDADSDADATTLVGINLEVFGILETALQEIQSRLEEFWAKPTPDSIADVDGVRTVSQVKCFVQLWRDLVQDAIPNLRFYGPKESPPALDCQTISSLHVMLLNLERVDSATLSLQRMWIPPDSNIEFVVIECLDARPVVRRSSLIDASGGDYTPPSSGPTIVKDGAWAENLFLSRDQYHKLGQFVSDIRAQVLAGSEHKFDLMYWAVKIVISIHNVPDGKIPIDSIKEILYPTATDFLSQLRQNRPTPDLGVLEAGVIGLALKHHIISVTNGLQTKGLLIGTIGELLPCQKTKDLPKALQLSDIPGLIAALDNTNKTTLALALFGLVNYYRLAPRLVGGSTSTAWHCVTLAAAVIDQTTDASNNSRLSIYVLMAEFAISEKKWPEARKALQKVDLITDAPGSSQASITENNAERRALDPLRSRVPQPKP